MRRLPVYFLLDSSLGMIGEPMWALHNSLNGLINSLRCIPEAIESVSISITLYCSEPEEVLPLTELNSIVLPIEFKNSQGGVLINTGKAIDFFITISESERKKRKKQVYLHHKPIVFLITNGSPDDKECYNTATNTINKSEYGYKIGCLLGKNNFTEFKQFSKAIIKIQDTQSESLKQFMMWSSQFILTIINDDGGTFDTEETLNSYYPILPQLTSALTLI